MSPNNNGEIKKLRDIIWGVVTDPLSQVEQLTLLIFLKLISDKHNDLEKMGSKKLIFTGEYKTYHFDALVKLAGYELVDTTRKAIESLHKNENIEQPLRRIYERSYLQVNDPRVLSLLIQEIGKIDFKSIDLGDFYEHILQALSANKGAGSFRTPRHLIKFIVDCVEPEIGDRILDPACGTAGFLTAAYLYIRNANTSEEAKKSKHYLDKLNPDQKKFLLNETIFGFDIDPNMIKFAITNLYLHDIKNPNISQHNTLTSNDQWEEKYEVIFANPPFSSPKGGIQPTDKFTLNSKRTEVLFVEYIIEHLTYNGKAGVIVPEGIIFTAKKDYQQLRKWLIDDNNLYAIISLPAGVFNPYAGVKTSILLMDKESAKKADKILYFKVENDGYDLGAQRREIDKNDLPEALEAVKNFQKDPSKEIDNTNCWTIEKEKIKKSEDYNLSGERYRNKGKVENSKYRFVSLKEIAEVISGQSPSSKNYNPAEKGLPFYQGKTEFGERYLGSPKVWTREITKIAVKNDILMSVRAPVGPVNISTTKICIGRGLAAIRANKELNFSYLFYLLKSKENEIKGSGGAVFDSISRKQIEEIKIPLPPLEVQKEIVEELDGYQKIIDGARQVVENYKPTIKIDPSWEMVELGVLCELIGGGTPSKSNKKYWENGTIKWLSAKHISNSGEIVGYDLITEEAAKKSATNVVPANSVIFVTRVSVGKLVYIDDKYAINQDLTGLVSKNVERLTPQYLYYVLSQNAELIKNAAQGLGVKGITRKYLSNFQIACPPMSEQEKIEKGMSEEKIIVENNKRLIEIYEQKIKDRIEEVWGK